MDGELESEYRIESKIWTAAYVRALRRRSPNRAELIAGDAVARFRKWQIRWRRDYGLEMGHFLRKKSSTID